MEKVEIDWIMVSNDESFGGTKTVKSGQKIMTVNELSKEVSFCIEENMVHRHMKYIFNDILALDDGVYKWIGNRFKKLADTYDSISPAICPQNIEEERLK